MTGGSVLRFDAAALSLSDGVRLVSFDLPAGRLAIVETDDAAGARALADAALGLAAPESGAVRVFGEDWAALAPRDAAAVRARIGVALAEDAPPPHLSALDAFALRLDWRGDADPERRLADCARAARAFGLPGAPETPPRDEADRRRVALAQAFLGQPELIVVERWSEPLSAGLQVALINALLRALARDAAALWIADPRDLARAPPPGSAIRVRLDAAPERAFAGAVARDPGDAR